MVECRFAVIRMDKEGRFRQSVSSTTAFACGTVVAADGIAAVLRKACGFVPGRSADTRRAVRTGIRFLRGAQDDRKVLHGFRFEHLCMKTGSNSMDDGNSGVNSGSDSVRDRRRDHNASGSELRLDRRDLKYGIDSGSRTVRLSRHSSLRNVDVEEGDPNRPVDINLAINPVRGCYRVKGRVKTRVTRECDRCLGRYDALTAGVFEVWLKTENSLISDTEEQELEAVEDFTGIHATVDLAPHVRDAILLSLPMKSLCSVDCAGPMHASGLKSAGRLFTIQGKSNVKEEDNVDLEERLEAEPASQSSPVGDPTRATLEALLHLKRTLEDPNNRS